MKMWDEIMRNYKYDNNRLEDDGVYTMIIEGAKDVYVREKEKTVITFVVLGGEHDGKTFSKFLDKDNHYDHGFLYRLTMACGLTEQDANGTKVARRGIDPYSLKDYKIRAELRRNDAGYLNIVKFEDSF